MQKGKLIVIEGIDGSGKSLQSALLSERLKKEAFKVKFIKFPQYEDNFFGKMARRYLNGEFGGVGAVNPYLASMLYAFDRWESKEKILKWLKQEYIVVCDRYADSNKIHQAGKLGNKEEKDKLLRWLDSLEYEVLGIPRPDVVFYLDVELSAALELMKLQEKKKDIHESDADYLKASQLEARRLAKKYGWVRIDCVKNGKILPPQEIHEKIWSSLTLSL